MSEQLISHAKRQRETIEFATGELTATGKIPFAITGYLTRGKDGLLFANNQTTVTIAGVNRSVGDTFDVIDYDGTEFGLRVKMSIGDSRRKFAPKEEPADPEKAGSSTVNIGV